MALPDFESNGELPAGLHQTTMSEALMRFGNATRQRRIVAARLLRIWNLVRATGKIERLVIFGSFVTAKHDPNDVDIVLVMRDDFIINDCDEETKMLFDHRRATGEFGASICWIRPSLLFLETVDEFIRHWQIKRDRTRRGIVEVIA